MSINTENLERIKELIKKLEEKRQSLPSNSLLRQKIQEQIDPLKNQIESLEKIKKS